MLLFGRVLKKDGHFLKQTCSIPLEGYYEIEEDPKPEVPEGYYLTSDLIIVGENQDRLKKVWKLKKNESEIEND